jgi:hypothetical protein
VSQVVTHYQLMIPIEAHQLQWTIEAQMISIEDYLMEYLIEACQIEQMFPAVVHLKEHLSLVPIGAHQQGCSMEQLFQC